MPIFQRRPNPPQHTNYRQYKQLLREDFRNRCAYCLLHEGHDSGGGYQNFHIDHFRPVSRFPDLEAVYTNLYYSCRWCNGNKSETWPTPEEDQLGYAFVDPCIEDFYKTHANVDPQSGKLNSLSRSGEYTIREIRLNSRILKRLRQRSLEAQDEIRQTEIRVAALKREPNPKVELISALEAKIRSLDEKYINPKIPYEPADLLVDN